MDSKRKIIIVAVIAIIAVVGGVLLFTNQLQFQHTTLVLSKSAYMESPVADNISAEPDDDGVFFYVDKDNGVNITSCSNISIANSSKTMKKIKNDAEKNSKKIYENGVIVYEKEGVYSIFVKNIDYNDSVVIQALSKDMALACWNTLKFHDPSDSLKLDNGTGGGTIINAAQQTEEVVQSVTEAAAESSSTSTETTSEVSTSSSDWGYDWGSESSYSGGSSSGSVGGSASVDDFDFG